MINKTLLIGNLTRDSEPLTSTRGPITRMRLATNRVWRDASGERQESTEYHTLVAFGRLAEVCALYGTRGKRLYVEGHLRTREYDGADGVHRVTTEVVVDSMRLLSRRDAATEAMESAGADDAEELATGVASD